MGRVSQLGDGLTSSCARGYVKCGREQALETHLLGVCV